MSLIMQEKITGKVLPETAEKTALRTVREILPETVPKEMCIRDRSAGNCDQIQAGGLSGDSAE